jgi:hypothetical protein
MKFKLYFLFANLLRKVAYYLELFSIKLRYWSNVSKVYGIESVNCSVEVKKEMFHILLKK